MLAADQGNHIAKPGAVQIDQLLTVAVFLDRHAIENQGRSRKVDAQPFGKTAIDPGVVLFGRDGQRQHLLFGQIDKAAAEGQ